MADDEPLKVTVQWPDLTPAQDEALRAVLGAAVERAVVDWIDGCPPEVRSFFLRPNLPPEALAAFVAVGRKAAFGLDPTEAMQHLAQVLRDWQLVDDDD